MRGAALVTFTLVAISAPSSSRGECPPDCSELQVRADAALQSFLLKFWNGTYLRHGYPVDGGPTWYWTYAQGFDALLDGVERTGGEHYEGLIETFFWAHNRLGWFNSWYDDMNWMVLALIRAYDLTSEPRYLDVAVSLFAEIMRGWDTTCCGDTPGGIWWNVGHSQKATASNAGPVISAVRLSERLEDESYLQFARQVYDYWDATMVTSSGQVYDHINPDGTIIAWRFTYNEGLMIGAAVELFLATGEDEYLADAELIAQFMIRNDTRTTVLGPILYDGSNSTCDVTCSAFKGIGFRYLSRLHEVAPDSSYANVLRSSAEAIWRIGRHPTQNVFSVDWGSFPTPDTSEPQMAAAVMALNIDARMNSEYPGDDAPANRYEAEDATITNVVVRDIGTDYTGWGFVGDWTRPNQGVTFQCAVERDGTYTARFRYAAASDGAIRRIIVDGETLTSAFVFPETESWSDYSTVDLGLELEPGVHRIFVYFDGPDDGPDSSSRGPLNLDNMTLLGGPPEFGRGDCNSDGNAELTDAVFLLGYSFLGTDAPACMAACDANGDGELSGVSDAVWLLSHLFLGGPPPAAPFPGCGPGTLPSDTEPEGLGCREYGSCP